MINNTMTTAIATPPMFFTISVSVKVFAVFAPSAGLAAASCNSIKRPRALVPKRLIRIVTVNPSKRFYLIDSKQRSRDDPRNRGDTTNALRSYCATKLYWITPVTLTGCPESFVGENFAERAAPTAAPCNRGCPDTACAETTLPFSSISTCTTTVPEACAALAIGGYAGFGKLIALPFRTPPEMGARGGVGVDAGGGGSSAI